MPSRTMRIPALFKKGLVTDRDPGDLDVNEAAELQDVTWAASGDLAKRGAFMYATGANPLNGRTQKLTGAWYWQPEVVPALAGTYLVMADAGGHVGAIASYAYNHGSATTSTTSTTLALSSSVIWPVGTWGGEILLTRPNSAGPIYRWAGSTASAVIGAGTVAVTEGENVVTGTGTSFLSNYTAGQYIVITDSKGVDYYFLVRNVFSNTSLVITGDLPLTGTGLSYRLLSFGLFNIQSEVTRFGKMSSSSTTVTGVGTTWTTGSDALAFDDIIGQSSVAVRHQILTVGGASSLTLDVAPSSAFTSGKYVATRRLTGHIIASHATRLWVAGLPWAPNRLQVSPAGMNPNEVWNGIDSKTTNPMEASLVEYVDIPESEPAEGRIVALASLNEPGPLLVLRDRDAYIVYGEWPSIQVTKLGEGIGATHWASVIEYRGTAYWAGPTGIYAYNPGGGVRELTEGRIRREWIALMRSLPTVAPNSLAERVPVVVTAFDGHLVVSVGDQAAPTTSTTYAYDLAAERWARWTGAAVRGASVATFPDRAMEALVTDQTTNRVIAISSATDETLAGSSNGVTGTLLATSGRGLLGGVGNPGRVTEAKITYRMAGANPAFKVRAGTGGTLSDEATISATTTGTSYATQRIKPSSGSMGTQARDFAINFTETTPATQLRIAEMELTTRLRRTGV